ncbi:uncharacterized protein PADG_01732 [Paracoccidioides brasiliensis Pb18]|uniref:DUF7924 domain-containing protein n=1 Tax=Paracoccidioides brasiliensis (strain Pb18) TaxID=502780 RepID=C1G466_PARBD|nr:uncharacterized protein PADG_01732 [Paracoccidioides brasiliensis Pb18]EEH45582.1 hypothetical protein PADG_01732 [Paracoccidioides brasiliensis Pb18]
MIHLTSFVKDYRQKNESRVIQYISRLIVPSAESLAVDGAKNLKHLVESVNEQWSSSIAFCGPRPQPHYAAGFGRSAFTEDQLKKFEPLLATTRIPIARSSWPHLLHVLPFLTSEVKGTTVLDIADRQNAHSMTLAVRGVVELFKLVGREDEVNRDILPGFLDLTRSQDFIEENKTSFYRHPIRTFDFTSEEGKHKWSAYTFAKNVYDKWMPDHLKSIRSAMDDIPPGVVSQSELGLCQSIAPSFVDDDDGQ